MIRTLKKGIPANHQNQRIWNQDDVWKSDVNSGLRIGNDNNVPSGTYYYLIQLGDGSDPISGFVVVNR